MAANKVGVLLTNLGTPEALNKKAVRRFLREFLSDPRVVELPRLLWIPILYAVILPFRPKKSLEAYAQIWTEAGSPLLDITLKQGKALQNVFDPNEVVVVPAMRYGQPSIANGLQQLQQHNVSKIFILPLYPQYSVSTSASTFDCIAKELKKWRVIPELRMLDNYALDANYITCIANSISNHFQDDDPSHRLLFSFHGLPQKMVDRGDPYAKQCFATVSQVAQQLQLKPDSWQITFQSRLGNTPWLQPYTDLTLEKLARDGIKKVTVICPGFAADCLETLEEINMRNRKIFLSAGGQEFNYIPALNDSAEHITCLQNIIKKNIHGWSNEYAYQ